LGRSFAFKLGLKPTFSFKGFHLGQVVTKPKTKKYTEVTGQGLPLDPKAGFEFSLGFGSSTVGGDDDDCHGWQVVCSNQF
jgi:hypothetical protein